jgi:hypothetical protein
VGVLVGPLWLGRCTDYNLLLAILPPLTNGRFSILYVGMMY